MRAIQTIAGIGETATETTPQGVRDIYDVLKLFSGDYSIVKADCIDPLPFHVQFYMALGHSIFIFIPMFAILFAAEPLSLRTLKKRDAGEVEIAAEKKWFKDRRVRCSLVAVALVYLTLGTRSIQALICVPIGEKLYLQISQGTECFTGQHLPIVFIASFLLGTIVIGYPIWLYVFYRKNKRGLYTSERFMEKYNFFYMQLKEERYNLFLLEFYIFFTLVVAKGLLPNDPMYQNTLISSGFGAKLGAVVTIKPFILDSDNTLQALISFFALFATNYNYIVSLGVLDGMRKISPALVVITFLIAAGIFVALIAIMIAQIMREAKLARDLANGDAFELGDDWMVTEHDRTNFAYSFDSSTAVRQDQPHGLHNLLSEAAKMRVWDEIDDEAADVSKTVSMARARRREEEAAANAGLFDSIFGTAEVDPNLNELMETVDLGPAAAWTAPAPIDEDDYYRTENPVHVDQWRAEFVARREAAARQARLDQEQAEESDESNGFFSFAM